MSGSSFSSGNIFNNGDMGSMKETYFNLKIKSANLYTMNLINDKLVDYIIERFTDVSQILLPFINVPKKRHYALELESFDNRIIIIEYGQYLNKNSERQSSGTFSSSSSRESKDNNLYYYLLNDGARFYEIDTKEITDNNSISLIIGANYYGISSDEVIKKMSSQKIYNERKFPDFSCCPLNVGNEITLGSLVNYFIEDNNWNAKDYDVVWHNCQDFVAKCIKILKLTRMNDLDKTRISELEFLSPCVLRALYFNEGWSAGNIALRILQRIPIIGLLIQSS